MPWSPRSTNVIYIYDTPTLSYVEWDGSLETGTLLIGAVNQSGTWVFSATSLPLPAGAATQATLASLLTELQLKADLTETQPVSGPLTDTQLRVTAVPVSGTVTASGPLTDAQLRATAVPISAVSLPTHGVTGPLTDTELRAVAVPVSYAALLTELQLKADLTETQPVSGPLTDTQLRATAVPVSGIVTASGPLTDTQLRAAAVPVSGTVTASGPVTDTQLRATAVPVSLATVPTHAVTGPLTDTELRATAVPVSGPVTDTQLRATAVPVAIGATVDSVNDDTAYTEGATGQALTLTPDGRLRVVVNALVSDVRESYVDAAIRALSLTTDGRLRVATSPSFLPTMDDLTPPFSSTDSSGGRVFPREGLAQWI